MRTGKRSATAAMLIVLSFLTSYTVYAFGRDVYTNTRMLADNLEYTNTVSYSDAIGRGESFSLRMTGPGDAYPIVTTSDTIYGTTTISNIVRYAEEQGLNVLAAVNSDFFSTQTGVPLGIVIEDGEYKSSPSGRVAVCFEESGVVSFVDAPSIRISLRINGDSDEPGDSGNPGGAGDPGGPGSPGSPGDPGDPDDPGGADNPGGSTAPSDPGDSGDPGIPDNPGDPGHPGNPDNPGDSGDPGDPGGADNPGDSGDPGDPTEGIPDTVSPEKVVNLSNLNKFRVDTGGMYLFTEAFSTVSTRTSTPGWFVVFKIIEGVPSVSGEMQLQVTDKLTSDGALKIEKGYMILTASTGAGYIEEYDKFEVGDRVTLKTTCYNEHLINARYATGGGDILISDGSISDSAEWDSALLQRAPRTAFGVREDGTVTCFVIDGRNSQHSVGMTLSELAGELQKQGCVYAVNFDGGGSSALSVRLPGEKNNAVVSMPSDGSERGCATYILFVTDAVSDGAARNLALKNDGAIILAGSSLDLIYTATDSGYFPAAVPDDVRVVSSVEDASVTGRRYTAGSGAGIDNLQLFSASAGAHGTGSVFVITQPTSITPSKKGSTAQLTSVVLQPGETLELAVAATYYRRTVTAQLLSFEYSITGEIGEMTSPGVFKAGSLMYQEGTLTVSAGGRSVDIKVEIGGFRDMTNHWAKDFAAYLASIGVVKGITHTEYGPELLMKRCDFVLMLYRAAGMPASEGSPSADDVNNTSALFADVPADAYYFDAVAWARKAGVTDGTGGNNFSPESPLSREQAFTFVYRALGLLNVPFADGSAEDVSAFPDAGEVADFAILPTATLINLGVVAGSDGMLLPRESLSRAQMAKILTVTLQLADERGGADDLSGGSDVYASDHETGFGYALITGSGSGRRGLG